MEQTVLRQLRWLKIYTLMSTLVFVALLFMAFSRNHMPPRFQEIEVERINVVEKDGTLKMVISNQEKQHSGRMD
ncbi:MAG: hypothetical protein H7Z21_20500, partial [Hymenobacter sp.]|nr:hypothetical protein [Hymenobacter sp.]